MRRLQSLDVKFSKPWKHPRRMTMRKTTFAIAISISCLFAAVEARGGDKYYNGAADFSSTSNPNGAWCYGYYAAPTAAPNPDLTVDFSGLPFTLYPKSVLTLTPANAPLSPFGS